MQNENIIIVSILILTATGVLSGFLSAFGYNRIMTAYIFLCCLAMNLFRVVIVPEFVINPAVILFILCAAVSCAKKANVGVVRIMLYTLVVSILQVTFSKYIGGAVLGLFMLITTPLFEPDTLPCSLVCATLAPAVAYVAAIFIDVIGFTRIDTFLDATEVLAAQLTGIISACASAWAAKQLYFKRAAKKAGGEM